MRNTTAGSVTLFALLLLNGTLLASEQEKTLGGVSYGTGDWPENGLGNHRAVVDVAAAAADAVRARIPWRRHDAEFRGKAVLVYDLATGAKIENVFACNITRECGDVVFQPRTVPGQYAIYYMPYQQPATTSGEWNGSYLAPRLVAEPGWLVRHGLSDATWPQAIRFVGSPRESEGGAIGSSFEIIAGSAVAFAQNDYAMTYEVRFADHRGPCVEPTLLLQSDGRGYRALVYDYGSQLVMGITRQDSNQSDVGEQLVKANWDTPWPVNMDRPLIATVTVKALPDRTVVTSQVKGTGDDGQAYTLPLLKAEDTSPRRLTGGGAPTFRIYPGDNNAGTWVRNLVIRNSAGQVVFDSSIARRGRGVENTATVPQAVLDAMPQARLVRMESRRRGGERPDMDSFYPMEVIASEAELSALLAKNAGPVLLFPEDRSRPVVMPDFLPQKWALDGPQSRFRGECQPGEYYCWQIGVYAAREDVGRLSLEYSDVRDAVGKVVIRGKDVTCFNLEGTNNRGERFTKEFKLGKGMVRPLWIGMMVPGDARGELQGEVEVKVNNHPAQTVRLVLKVDGPVIPNHGDDEPWRHSRLRWLNSTLGLDDNIVPLPFTPVKRRGATVEILNRAIDVNELGLPDRIVSNGTDVLASPICIEILAADGRPLALAAVKRALELENPSRVSEVAQATCGALSVTVRSELWFDGAINYELSLRGEKDATLKDVALVIPIRKKLAKYFVGFSNRGDRRPAAWQWKWDRRYEDNAAWCGDVEAGLGIKLLGEHDYWDLSGLRWDEHRQWINDGKGGARLVEDGDAVVLRVFTGQTSLRAGAPTRLRFRLYVTPFKPLRNDHWDLRFFGNIAHYHHSTRENPYINYPFMTVGLMKRAFEDIKAKGQRGMTIYYTLRELSNIAPELFAFRSLGDEIIKSSGAFVYSTSGWRIAGEGGGHPWLREHLVSGYSPSWQQTVPSGEIDAAVATNGDGRLVNYYIEGLAYLQRKIGFVGVYLDGIGFDRIAMLRLARTLTAGGSDYYLPFHSGDNFKNPWSEHHAAPVAQYMEHLPYVTQLMFGEVFWFDGPEGYWMTNLAGLPFGIDNQFYPVPGPDYPFRSMLYVSSPNVGPSAADIRALWDRWGINKQTRTLGYWDANCPVKTNARNVFASVYANEGKALVCVGSWAQEATPVRLSVDWQALGMDPAKVRVSLPDIGSVQKPQEKVDLSQPITVDPGKGLVVGIESR